MIKLVYTNIIGGTKVNVLKIVVNGLELFNNELIIDFNTEQKVTNTNNDMVTNTFNNIYTNNAISFVGVNASGKTTILKVISFIFDFINCKPINCIETRHILNNSDIVSIDIYFYDEEKGIGKLHTDISNIKDSKNEIHYYISEETLWFKKITKNLSKKTLFDFKESNIYYERNNNEEFLKDDISIIISVNKNKTLHIVDLLECTDINILKLIGNFPHELFAFLDASIENIIHDKEKNEFRLKFHGKEEIILSHPLDFNNYLSSGTIKGINVFVSAMLAFQEGGYLIIDEIENHFHKEIASILIRFFMDKNVNKKGATIIFSTHYSELLDEFNRNDCIYVVRNEQGITSEKLSNILHRNDIKKSEAYLSDLLHGTAPSYEAYLGLKNAIIHGEIKGA